MKKEWKERWLKALRSGEYRQSREMLRRHRGGYCCLGVLCDIVDPDGWQERDLNCDEIEFKYKRSVAAGMPPNNVLTLVGLDKHRAADLANLNDREEASFAEIADWIEKKL